MTATLSKRESSPFKRLDVETGLQSSVWQNCHPAIFDERSLYDL